MALCMILAISALTCAQKEEPAETPLTISATDLWQIIGQEKPYTEYGFWSGLEGIMKGQSPHGALVRTFVNDHALNPGLEGYPYGSIIVKENFMADTTLAKLTVMYKVKGYNPEAGDWFWAVYGPDGTAEMEGKIQSCISCHGMRQGDDFVLLRSLK
jgi:hypothetical protein